MVSRPAAAGFRSSAQLPSAQKRMPSSVTSSASGPVPSGARSCAIWGTRQAAPVPMARCSTVRVASPSNCTWSCPMALSRAAKSCASAWTVWGNTSKSPYQPRSSAASSGPARPRPARPAIANAVLRHHVPNVVAAVDNHAGLCQPSAFRCRVRVGVRAGIIVAVDVERRLVGNKEVAASRMRCFERGPLTLPSDGNTVHVGAGLTRLECIHGLGPIHPRADSGACGDRDQSRASKLPLSLGNSPLVDTTTLKNSSVLCVDRSKEGNRVESEWNRVHFLWRTELADTGLISSRVPEPA